MFDLDKIDGGLQTDPPPKKSGGFNLDKIPDFAPKGNLPGSLTGLDFNDFRFQPKTNTDNYKLRAQNQRWYEQAGLTLGNLIPNIATGIVEGFGYIPELWDGEQDYSNALTRKMQEWKNPLGEVYRENPNEVWDMKDPAWWFSKIGMLVESASAFAVQSAGWGKLFGTIAKGAAEAMTLGRAGKIAGTIANRSAQLLTASTLAYTEGAMSGAQVYEKTYNNVRLKAIRSGATPEEADVYAREEASAAAAMTVKVSTAMNTMLNMGVIAPMFRSADEKLLAWAKTQGRRIDGEDLATYNKRIAGTTIESAEIREAIKNRTGFISIPAEMIKEGVEEVNTMYAEQVGERRGEGQKEGLLSALTNLDNYFKDVMNEEGALNFALGIVGGAAETVLLDNIPSKYVPKLGEDGQAIQQTDADGKLVYDSKGKPKYVKELVRPKTYNERGMKEYFENIKQSITADITRQQDLHAKLVTAAEKKDLAEVEKLRSELFSIQALDAVQKGFAENWIEEYKQIGAADNTRNLAEDLDPQIEEIKEALQTAETEEQRAELNQQLGTLLTQREALDGKTEAMQKGYATSKNDNEYKQRAQDAQMDLQHLQKLHDSVQKRYVSEDDPISGEVGDHIFFRRANLYLHRRAIKKESDRLEKLEETERMTELLDENLVDREINRHNRTVSVWNDTIQKLNTDIQAIQEAVKRKDLKLIEEMIGKYNGKGETAEEAWEDVLKKIQNKQKQYEVAVNASRNSMEQSSKYTLWQEQNPGKTFNDFLNTIKENVTLRRDKANLEHVKAQADIAEENLNELETENGTAQIYKIISSERKKAIQQMEEKVKKSNLETYLREQNKKNAARLSAQEKQMLVAQKQEQIRNLQEEFNKLEEKRVSLQTQIAELSKGFGNVTNFNSIMKLKSELSLVQAQLRSTSARLNQLEEELLLLGIKAEVATQQAANTEAQTGEQIDEEVKAEKAEVPEQFDMSYQEALEKDAQAAADAADPAQPGTTVDFSIEELTRERDPHKEYLAIIEKMTAKSKRVAEKIGQLELEFSKTGEVSWDRVSRELNEYVSRGIIETQDVSDVYFALRDYIPVKSAAVVPAQTIPVQSPAEDVQAVEAEPLIIESEQPQIFINEAIWTDEGIEEQYWASSPKAITAVKVNSADVQYMTIQYGGKLKMKTKTELKDKIWSPVLDPTSNKDRMIAGRIQIGDEVELIPDVDWDGRINNHHTLEFDEDLNTPKTDDSFGNYINPDGTIRTKEQMKYQGYANVPIKIVHKKSGKVIGYFPMNDWVTSTVGAMNTRNIPQAFMQQEAKTNLDIRRYIAEKWNESKTGVSTTITGRSAGRLQYAGEVNSATGKVKYQKLQTAKLIKDPSIMFGVATTEQFLIGKGVPASTKLKMTQELTPQTMPGLVRRDTKSVVSAPVMFLPMPDGTFMPSPLETYKLDRKGDVQTVAKVIEIFLKRQARMELSSAEKKISVGILNDSAIGFDIETAQGLRDFIQQYYTYTTQFNDSTTMLSSPAEVDADGKASKVQKWMIDIQDDGTIKIGTRYSGRAPIIARLSGGALSQDFMQDLTTGLATRFKNVTFTNGNLRGLNDNRPITSVTVTSTGELRKFPHANYNEYLKTFTQTAVYGLQQVDGQYVYGVNSQIYLDPTKLNPPKLTPIDLAVEGALAPDPTGIDDLASALDDALNGSAPISIPSQRIAPQGQPLSLENLTNLHTFTPASQRNDKTPEEVYEYLTGMNITTLADGYNPFRKCS